MPVSPTQPPFRLFAQSFDIKLARILQVARQSLRTATRSRFAASLAALLALVALALPSLVPGDGSPEGDMRILLAWAPGLATILLGAATLWAGCGALATDIEDGTWAGISSTRASRLQLWLGKWLGLVALDAILLAAALGLCAVQARLRGLPVARLRPHAVVAPDESEFRAQAAEAARRMLADTQGAAAADAMPTNAADLAERLFSDLHESPISFSAGNSFRWRFPVGGGRGFRHAESARLRLEIVSPFGTAAQIHGRLTVHAESTPRVPPTLRGNVAEAPARQNPHAEGAEAPARQNPHAEGAEGAEFNTHEENAEDAESGRSGIRGESVPSVGDSGAAASVGNPLHPCEAIAPEVGAPLAERVIAPEDNRDLWLDVPGERLAGVDHIIVEFENTGAEGDPAALVDVVHGIRFTVPRGSVAGNLARVWAVQLALLALLAAIGTACGAMFTRPVAVFAATAVAVMGIVSQAGFDEEPAHVHDHGDDKEPSAITQFHANASRFLMHRIALCTQPVADASAFDHLGDSTLVEAPPVLHALWLDGVVLPVLFGVFSALVLRRREPQGSP